MCVDMEMESLLRDSGMEGTGRKVSEGLLLSAIVLRICS